jgi:hypothetical protein
MVPANKKFVKQHWGLKQNKRAHQFDAPSPASYEGDLNCRPYYFA